MKDPFRVKKNVTFVIALDDSDSDESGDGRVSPELKREEESEPARSASPNKKAK